MLQYINSVYKSITIYRYDSDMGELQSIVFYTKKGWVHPQHLSIENQSHGCVRQTSSSSKHSVVVYGKPDGYLNVWSTGILKSDVFKLKLAKYIIRLLSFIGAAINFRYLKP